MKMHENAAFSRTSSNADNGNIKLAVRDALTAPSTDDEQVTEQPADRGLGTPKGVPAKMPMAPVHVEAYLMGNCSVRGIPEKVTLCQVFPASLSGRRQAYCDVSVHGKAANSSKGSSLALAAKVMLPDILHLPLSAEPPLCINMVVPHLLDSPQTVSNRLR